MKVESIDLVGIESLRVLKSDPSVGVVFLHGYGANMHDLFPLWEIWDKPNFSWYFPNGVYGLDMGHYEGRAWFSIDVERLEYAMRTGTHREMKGVVPPEFDQTLGQLELLILELMKKHDTIVVGGFSQGAMCASHLAMKANLKIDGLVLLSGGLIAEEKMPAQAKGIPFYQSHGTRDPVLSVDGAKDLEKKLMNLNFKGKLHTFNGAHEIPPTVIHEVNSFLDQFAGV